MPAAAFVDRWAGFVSSNGDWFRPKALDALLTPTVLSCNRVRGESNTNITYSVQSNQMKQHLDCAARGATCANLLAGLTLIITSPYPSRVLLNYLIHTYFLCLSLSLFSLISRLPAAHPLVISATPDFLSASHCYPSTYSSFKVSRYFILKLFQFQFISSSFFFIWYIVMQGDQEFSIVIREFRALIILKP